MSILQDFNRQTSTRVKYLKTSKEGPQCKDYKCKKSCKELIYLNKFDEMTYMPIRGNNKLYKLSTTLSHFFVI